MENSVIRIEGEVSMERYLREFRDVDTFMECCRACTNFAKRWHCPPLAPEFLIDFRKYDRVRVVGYKILPAASDTDARKVLTGPARQLGAELLSLERQLNGRAMGLAQLDGCLCGGECTRASGEPCRRPDIVRPALEAYGFDVVRTAREILGLELLWCRDGRLPEYLSLVGAVCYNGSI